MRTIRLHESKCAPEAYVRTLVKEKGRVSSLHYDPDNVISGEDTDVYKPDGSVLLKFRAGVLPRPLCDTVRPSLRKAARTTNNRGVHERRRKQDGTLSNTGMAPPQQSGLVGYFDRTPREPFCRTTEFSFDPRRREDFAWITTLAQAADGVFARECPDRYGAQSAAVSKTGSEWVLPETVFTTVTVNRNFPTHVHVDKGDLPEGFGVLTVIEQGEYDGCYLVFPRYRVAVDLRTTDVLLCDVHEAHGNSPFVGIKGEYERLTAVLYFRKNMVKCRSRAEEVRLAQTRPAGTPLNTD